MRRVVSIAAMLVALGGCAAGAVRPDPDDATLPPAVVLMRESDPAPRVHEDIRLDVLMLPHGDPRARCEQWGGEWHEDTNICEGRNH
jgi:hypothetical protein